MTNSEIASNSMAFVAIVISIYSIYIQRFDKKARLNIKSSFKELSRGVYFGDESSLIESPNSTQMLIISNPTQFDIYVDKIEFLIGSNNVNEIEHFSPSQKVSAKAQLELELSRFNFGDETGFFLVQDAVGNKFKSKKLKLNHTPTNS